MAIEEIVHPPTFGKPEFAEVQLFPESVVFANSL